MFYILDKNNKVVKVDSLQEQFEWQIGNSFHVGDDYVQGIRISTVFLGVSTIFKGKPLVFETMTFDLEGNTNLIGRYATWEEAEKGHLEAVKNIGISFKEFQKN